MSARVKVRRIDPDEARAKIAAILDEYPMLATAHELNDCECCIQWDVLDEHGPGAARAYRELERLRWLLGEDA